MADPDSATLADPTQGGAGQAGTSPSHGVRGVRLSEGWALLELFAVCGLVVVQPVLEIIGNSPDFFIFHGVGTGEIVALVAALALVPPVALWGLGALARFAGGRVRWTVHIAVLGALFVLFSIQIGKHLTSVRGGLLAGAAVLAAAVIVVGYLRFDATRQLLRFAAIGPLVFVLLFTFASPASAVMFSRETPATGGQAREVGPHPPIVMILLDELPLVSLLDGAGDIDAERFPNFARLAGESTWYRNATGAAGWTPYALPAMLTGRWPAESVAAHFAEYPDNLLTLLGDVYQIRAIETISRLCPPWHCGDRAREASGGLPVALAESATVLGELISPAEPARDPTGGFRERTLAERLGVARAAAEQGPEFLFNQARSENRPARFVDFLDWLEPRALATAEEPTLHFLHLLLPHHPWVYLPSGMRYPAPHLPTHGDWWPQLARQRHLAQLEYTDLLLGQTIGALEAAGRYDDALVVVTSDHGYSFTPGAVGRDLDDSERGAAELAWVPLFIKEPGQVDGAVDDRNYQHVDLLPTVADYAGVEVPWSTDGISARRERRTGTDKIYYEDIQDRRVFDGAALFDAIYDFPGAVPPLPPPPLPELVGRRVDRLPVTDAGRGAVVDNADAFADVDLEGGTVPALGYGTVPDDVPVGTPLAIAVNGRIGAVVPVVAGVDGTGRFAGLVEDETLFRAGENRLELFLVATDGFPGGVGADPATDDRVQLQRLSLDKR